MSGTPICIMIIDDERSVRKSLAAYLEDRGFKALTAESAEEALELIENETVDIAIVDMRLPKMDGNALIVNAHKINPLLAYLIYTGSTDYSPPPALLEIGVEARNVFHKPLIDLNLLVDAINRLVRESKQIQVDNPLV